MADEIDRRITKLEIDLGALKEKVTFTDLIYSKLDLTLDKLQELIETRRYEMNEELKEVYKRIIETEQKVAVKVEATEAKILTELKKVEDKFELRLKVFDRWMWTVIGAAGLGGWMIYWIFSFVTARVGS